MAKSILIVEDDITDIRWYRSLFDQQREVSLLFYNNNKDKNYSKEKLLEVLELFYEDLYKKIKNVYIYGDKSISDFLKNNSFDFYIFDSLGDVAEELIKDSGLLKDRVAILSKTTLFREFMESKGYRVYGKADINKLIEECIK